MEEREFFDERPEKKMATLNCPHCHQPAEYEVSWIVRTKKRQLAVLHAAQRRPDGLQKHALPQTLRNLRSAVRGVYGLAISTQPSAFFNLEALRSCATSRLG
jgi:hypothetical protein